MGKFSLALYVSVLVVSSFSWSASAMASHSYKFQGYVSVFKSMQLDCTLTVIKTPNHDRVTGYDLDTGTVLVHISMPTSTHCSALGITNNPMNYAQGPVGVDGWRSMTIFGFKVETFTIGNCYGDVVVKEREVSPGVWDMDVSTVIPPEFSGGPCYVEGVIPSI